MSELTDVERLARAMHDSTWSGHWLHDFGTECPDGEADAEIWRKKATELIRELRRQRLTVTPYTFEAEETGER